VWDRDRYQREQATTGRENTRYHPKKAQKNRSQKTVVGERCRRNDHVQGSEISTSVGCGATGKKERPRPALADSLALLSALVYLMASVCLAPLFSRSRMTTTHHDILLFIPGLRDGAEWALLRSSLLHAPVLDLVPGLYRIKSAFTSNNELAEPEPARPRARAPAIHLLPFAQSISPLLTPLSLRRPGLEIARPRLPHRRAARCPDPASAPPVPSVPHGRQDTSCRRTPSSPASPIARARTVLSLIRRDECRRALQVGELTRRPPPLREYLADASTQFGR
jgi:hypothetical protein